MPIIPLMMAFGVGITLLAGAKTTALAAVATNAVNQRQGHRSGEGPLSRRAGGAGIMVGRRSNTLAGRYLAILKPFAPELEQYQGKLLEATVAEGEDLDKVLAPVIALMDHLLAGAPPELTAEHIRSAMGPVVVWLERFPKSRVRTVSDAIRKALGGA